MSLLIRDMQYQLKSFVSFWSLIMSISVLSMASVKAQGIKFIGSEQSIDKRSSLKVFPSKDVEFKDQFNLSFDLQISSNSPIGYVFRIKEKSQKGIINLYYDEENGKAIFRLNEEGKYGLITSTFDRATLLEQPWIGIKLNFDLQAGEITLKIADFPEQKAKVNITSPYAPTIFFGKSDYMIDVPSMSIRNLIVGNDAEIYEFPLKESEGNLLHDSNAEIRGEVTHGVWLVNKAYNWHKLMQFQSETEAGSEYNLKTRSVYYFNRDSIKIYNLASGEIQKLKFATPCPVKLVRGNTFIDEQTNKLYVYETFYNQPYDGPTIASLDLNTLEWTAQSDDYFGNEINHHGYLLLPNSTNFLIFGGFGAMRYSKEFSMYSLKDKRWNKNIPTTGTQIFPRYFTSMGYSLTRKKAFIFGGMGNESGEHTVGRQYFYDLYSFDLITNQVEKLWAIDWKEKPFVPARGLVIPDDNYVYLLGYPEHLTHSFIKLRRFSLQDGEYEQLGDSIPIYSDKISTRAKLYYDDHLNKLITIVQESDDDIRSDLTIYSIDYPAISFSALHSFPNAKNSTYFLPVICIGVGILLIIVFFLIRRRKKIAEEGIFGENEMDTVVSKPRRKTNCIYLFGDLTLINKQGMDISHLLSSRLKQVFCLILFHSKETGISSTLLSHLLWPDKPKDKVKTSRGVAINNLRKVLNELQGVEIVYEEGHFRMVFTTDCYCDYHALQEELKENPSELLSQDLYKIIDRGQFLLGIDDPIFDQVKLELENQLLSVLEKDLNNYIQLKQYPSAIQAGETILNIDTINENALEKTLIALYASKNEDKAKKIYTKFVDQFELTMGEKFHHSFDQYWK